jgi:SAM-dependent methyltransferase
LYAKPKRGLEPLDQTYHRIDLPGFENKEWLWDLRGQESDYLGGYDFSGKRVLEFGPANGGLTFWMERQGAEVVAVDLSPGLTEGWDLIVGPGEEVETIRRDQAAGIEWLNNQFWYAHEQLRSNAKLVHATAYRVPREIGRFDVVTLGAILLHLRDPLRALENAIIFTDDALIITDAVPRFVPDDIQKLPLAYFMPEEKRRKAHGRWTWWQITAEVYVRFLTLRGFNIVRNTVNIYKHISGPQKLYTIVARRSAEETVLSRT